MKKESVIGFILIGVIMFGFSWYQSHEFKKQQEAVKAYNDSLALVQRTEMALDSLARIEAEAKGETYVSRFVQAPVESAPKTQNYKDSLLTAAAADEATFVILENDRICMELATRGAAPYSVRVKDFKAYGGDSLMLVRPGFSDYNISVYAGENINTRDFNFTVAEATRESVSLRLYFANGGYIQQKYTLPENSYMVYDELSFVGMGDIIPRNVSSFYIDWSLAVPRLEKGYKNEKQYSKLDVLCPGDTKPDVIGSGRDGSKRYDTKVEWFNFHQQFFSAIMTAKDGFASGDFSLKFAEDGDKEGTLMNCKAALRSDLALNGGNAAYEYEFYFGPNNYRILKSYDRNYDKVITIGGRLIGLITRFVIIPCFEFLSRFFKSYGLIILLMTLLIKLVISPLTIKSYMSSAKMNAIKPEVDKINEKYPKAATDQKEAMKKQQATMDLYKRAGINPAGGCLPMLLQFPILWAMFRFFPASIELRQQSFLWADDLSAYDSILDFGFSILGVDHLSLFALLMALSMFVYSKMTMPATDDPQMKPMRFMSVWMMPIMMFFICNSLSAALSYYYLLSNLVTMAQTFVIKKWIVKPEKLLAEIEANKKKPLQKSKWQLRLEQAQKMAEQQQRAAAKRR